MRGKARRQGDGEAGCAARGHDAVQTALEEFRAGWAEMGRGAHFRLDGELREANVPIRPGRSGGILGELPHHPEQGSQTHSINKSKLRYWAL